MASDSLGPHGLQHARLPCPLPAPGACSNSCPYQLLEPAQTHVHRVGDAIQLSSQKRKKEIVFYYVCCSFQYQTVNNNNNGWKWKKVKVTQSCLTLCDPMDYTQSIECSRPENWSGLPFPSPGDLPNSGLKSRSLTLQVDSLPAEPPGKPKQWLALVYFMLGIVSRVC